jgi:hypothetical protein
MAAPAPTRIQSPSKRFKTLFTRLPAQTAVALEEAARADSRPTSAMIRVIVSQWLDRERSLHRQARSIVTEPTA